MALLELLALQEAQDHKAAQERLVQQVWWVQQVLQDHKDLLVFGVAQVPQVYRDQLEPRVQPVCQGPQDQLARQELVL